MGNETGTMAHTQHKDFAQRACGFGTMAKAGRPEVRPIHNAS